MGWGQTRDGDTSSQTSGLQSTTTRALMRITLERAKRTNRLKRLNERNETNPTTPSVDLGDRIAKMHPRERIGQKGARRHLLEECGTYTARQARQLIPHDGRGGRDVVRRTTPRADGTEHRRLIGDKVDPDRHRAGGRSTEPLRERRRNRKRGVTLERVNRRGNVKVIKS